MNTAIGLIETLGLVPLLNAVDAALKAANVKTASGVMKLDGGIVVDKDAGDARLRHVGDVLDEAMQVEAGADDAEYLVAIAHQHVDPELDHAQLGVRIDVDMEIAVFLDDGVEPDVVRTARIRTEPP